ncbi:hypothetical protein OS189_15815 [Sulfitobacter sp. F26169L]|uniref:hypothetical protein n=1 Tax=Sulfitobacter sp. F26169L TaxID=2996015 RepID=UPI002260A7EB|nr:hypothetical protein [Sulfitobacter sp. F26169L]MCX7567811.1 hypothetical protein [Sulfitobacter sp. F26169L]
MRRSLLTAFALCLVTAFPALAKSCPTRADLNGDGIRLTRSAPFMTVLLTNRGDTQISERRVKRNGKTTRVRSTYLHPLAVAQRQDTRSVLTMKYSRNTKSLQNLDNTKVWRSRIEILDGTKTIDKGSVTMRLGGKGTHTVGGCKYPVWSVVETYETGKLPISSREKIYAPTLGIVLTSYALGRDGKRRRSGFAPDKISAE